MNLLRLVEQFGLLPHHYYSLYSSYLPLGDLALWLLFLPIALLKRIGRFYNASLRAAFFEELVFRGFVYGGIRLIGGTIFQAFIGSSLLFGVFHMRNLWWAGWRRSWHMTRYAGFLAGPLFCLLRILSGDIYIGILIHFLHNLMVILPPPGMGRFMAKTPTDRELREAQQ
jgi:membrane protease YdiL (CAAX protease family)